MNTHVWKNKNTASSRFCRPIKCIFEKKTSEMVHIETNLILEQIANLIPTKIIIDDVEITITHKLLLTMVDGKVCNTLTDTRSSQMCFICGATPKVMNTIGNQSLIANNTNYNFGISNITCVDSNY